MTVRFKFGQITDEDATGKEFTRKQTVVTVSVRRTTRGEEIADAAGFLREFCSDMLEHGHYTVSVGGREK